MIRTLARDATSVHKCVTALSETGLLYSPYSLFCSILGARSSPTPAKVGRLLPKKKKKKGLCRRTAVPLTAVTQHVMLPDAAQNSTIRPRSKSALPGIEVSQMKWNMQVHARPKRRGRRQSWMSKSPFPAFDAHSNGARLSQQCYPIFCLFPGCNVQPFWCSDALAYQYKVFHPKSDAICSAQPFEAPKHRARGSRPEGYAFLDNAQTVKATEHHYEEAGDVFICDYADCQCAGPFKRLTRLRDHLRGVHGETIERRRRNAIVNFPGYLRCYTCLGKTPIGTQGERCYGCQRPQVDERQPHSGARMMKYGNGVVILDDPKLCRSG